MKPRKKTSRCIAVKAEEDINIARFTTGGLFATVNMRMGSGGHGNRILQLAEMLNSENKQYKITLLKALKKKKHKGRQIVIGKYAHDCSCTLVKDIEGTLVERAYLDSYHGPKHKCRTPTVTKSRFPKLNSQACEQLWKRMEGLQTTFSHLGRAKYRMFLKHYVKWRNAFSSGKHRSDMNPAISKRRRARRS